MQLQPAGLARGSGDGAGVRRLGLERPAAVVPEEKQDHPAYIPRLGCPGRKPPSAGRDQYALKLESLIPALQPDYEPSICEWRLRLGDVPGLTGDADVDVAPGICGLRGDRCQRRHIGCGHGDKEFGRAGGLGDRRGGDRYRLTKLAVAQAGTGARPRERGGTGRAPARC